MPIIDKNGLLPRVERGESFAIELGCGPRKQNPAAIGIDLLDYPGVDLVGDVFEALASFPDVSASGLYASHFVEHIDDLPRLLSEIARVLRPNAVARIIVPHFSNPFFHSDPTHRVSFGLYSLAYFCETTLFSRTVPRYGFTVPMTLEEVGLGFKSYPPRYLRHALKRLVGAIVNSSVFMTEFYEENLCWLLPCYELRYVLRKT